MAGTDSQMKVMRLNEPGGELLDAKYFCKVTNLQVDYFHRFLTLGLFFTYNLSYSAQHFLKAFFCVCKRSAVTFF